MYSSAKKTRKKSISASITTEKTNSAPHHFAVLIMKISGGKSNLNQPRPFLSALIFKGGRVMTISYSDTYYEISPVRFTAEPMANDQVQYTRIDRETLRARHRQLKPYRTEFKTRAAAAKQFKDLKLDPDHFHISECCSVHGLL
jgi:hypothetical protein